MNYRNFLFNVLLIIVISTSTIYKTSLAQWQRLDVDCLNNEDLYSVFFIDSQKGWIAGDNGIIIHTTDGGIDWSLQNSGTDERLLDIYFFNETCGWAVGYNGIIIQTDNGGATWSIQNSGTDYRLYSVFAISENNCWIAGSKIFEDRGILLHSTNGGSAWVTYMETDHYLRDLYFIDMLHGWIIGDRVRSFSSNGYNCIYKTNDGGMNWSIIDTIAIGGISCICLHFNNNADGFIVGQHCKIERTNDGGSSWESYSGYGIPGWGIILQEVHFSSINCGCAVGDEGTIVYTTNGGTSWFQQGSNTNKELNSVHLISDEIGFVVGDYGTVLSYGEFVSRPLSVTGPSNGYINVSYGFNSYTSKCNYGHDVEYQFDWGDGTLSDWGSLTQYHTFNTTGSYYIRARTRCQENSDIVSEWSSKRVIIIIQMGWLTNRLYLSGTDHILTENSTGQFPGNSVEINGENPSVEWDGYYLNGDIIGNVYYLNIWAVSPYIFGGQGQTTTNFRAEFFINNTIVATIYFSSSWFETSSGARYATAGIDPTTSVGDEVKLRISYTSGYGGTIYWGIGSDIDSYIEIPDITTNIQSIEYKQLPDNLILLQNYPNPFNSSTEIKYRLPSDLKVQLLIYNTKGQFINKIVDGFETAGFKTVKWDGKNGYGFNVPSGIYLYKLIADDFIHIRKMILQK